MDIDGAPEDAVKACRIHDGIESCVIGFLPRHVVMSNKERLFGKFAQIVELCEDSDNRTKRFKIYKFRHGCIVSFRRNSIELI